MLSSISGAMTRLSIFRGKGRRVCIAALCGAVVWMAGATVPTAVSVPPTTYHPYEGTMYPFPPSPTALNTQSSPSLAPTFTPSPAPSASRTTSVKAEPTSKPKSNISGGTLVAKGVATWYDDGPGLYGAAGPALRTGNWRGRAVTVCSGSRCVRIRLTDWCACGSRNGRQTVVDLSTSAFRALAPLSRGVITVEVRR